MSRSIVLRFAACAAFAALAALAIERAGAQASATTPGDLWEVTSNMAMAGFAMPAQTHRVCAPKDWSEPPGGANGPGGECKTSEFKVAGSTVTWKVVCEDGMSGEGEITRSSPDAYAGEVRFSSADGAMTMKISGHRVGACEARS